LTGRLLIRILGQSRLYRSTLYSVFCSLDLACVQVGDLQLGEKIRFTQRFLQWSVADAWLRPMYRIDSSGGPELPSNYINNKTACLPYIGCGQMQLIQGYSPVDFDALGQLQNDVAYPGYLPIPADGNKAWTVSEDGQGSGALVTVMVQGQSVPAEQPLRLSVKACPSTGCLAAPPAPPPPVDKGMSLWSDPATWIGTQDHPANPMNTLKQVLVSKGKYNFQVVSSQNWTGQIPGPGDNVWIPPWTKVPDLSRPFSSVRLRHLFMSFQLIS
jgi:hypothetical protein